MNTSTVPRSVKRLFPNVVKFKESRQPIDIEVISRDVSGGKRLQGNSCAMARAVCRQTQADGAIIGISYSYLIKGDTVTKYQTSVAVAREITSFDRNHDFALGEYRLSPVAPSQSRKAQAKRAKSRKTKSVSGPKNQRRIVHKETVNVRSFRRKDA